MLVVRCMTHVRFETYGRVDGGCLAVWTCMPFWQSGEEERMVTECLLLQCHDFVAISFHLIVALASRDPRVGARAKHNK